MDNKKENKLRDSTDDPERKFSTVSGISVDPIYVNPGSDPGSPGQYPFTRGVWPTMYRGKLWTMRQYAGFGTAEESNRRYRYLLAEGQTGLSIAFDLPTQIGYDSDDPLARGEVGKVGVAIDTVADMEALFAGIPLDQISTSMTINAPAAIIFAFYLAVAQKQGIAGENLRGTIQNDILKEYIARGTYIFPPRPSMRLITDTFRYCAQSVPQWNTISISGYHIREAGATAAQEIAFTLANAIAYVEAAVAAGLKIDDFAPRLSFFFNAFTDLFEEVAKFRAARRMWAKIMKERFHGSAKSQMLRFHTQTAGSTLTAQQPQNNIVRVAIQALSAVLGGTQSLHTNAADEALALPTEDSVRTALRTQQIIAYESGVASTVDPLGGSYFLEHLTGAVEAQAREYLDAIDRMGGATAAIEKGYMQQEIQKSAYRYQKEIESKERVIVGVNRFEVDEDNAPALLKLSPEIEEQQIEKLRKVRAQRNRERVDGVLAKIENAAQTGDNLMPLFLEAAHHYVSLGEMCSVLRKVFGEYQPKIVL